MPFAAVAIARVSRLLSAHALLATALLAAQPAPASAVIAHGDATGAMLYQRECAPCHGPTGRGDGPEGIYFAPPPRDLREGFLALYPPEEVVEKIRRGRPLKLEIDPQAVHRRAEMIEQIVAHMNRMQDVDWDAIERGATIYGARCEICHGPFGRPVPKAVLPPGVQRAPRDLASPELQRDLDDEHLALVARHGRAGMPAIPPLATEQETRDLVAYLRLLSPGFAYYSLWCGGCHGDDGRGEGVFAVGPDAPTVVLDRAYLKAQDPEVLRRNVMHMLDRQEAAMPHFERELTEAQARAIVDYLRQSGPAATPTPGRAP